MHALHVLAERRGAGGGGGCFELQNVFSSSTKGKAKVNSKKNKGKKFEQQKLTQQLQPVA